ncbi:MAG: hypothetical protein HOV71_06980 [Hamadaea sp.]|nr:hypothetical protein [Hamadaea sp.]NUP44523.1 hypothetical protein [Streptomyces sp.]NUR47860.1 hypothetical protein [Hamadaea sp.]NUT07039.1 hypothetical protein [Hamadaea sp.]
MTSVEHIRDAARADQYWALVPQGPGFWALCRFDDTTGFVGPPVHVSGTIGVHPGVAVAWAQRITGLAGWVPMTSRPGILVEEAYSLVLEIARQPRTGRRIVLRVEADPQRPSGASVVVRERWDASGLYSDALSVVDRAEFADETQMLQQTAEGFGLDPALWTPVLPGVEYAHGPLA